MMALTSSVAASARGELSGEVTLTRPDREQGGNGPAGAGPEGATALSAVGPLARRPRAATGRPRSVAMNTVAPLLVGQDRSMHRARASEVLARARLKVTATRRSAAFKTTAPAIVLGRHSVSAWCERSPTMCPLASMA